MVLSDVERFQFVRQQGGMFSRWFPHRPVGCTSSQVTGQIHYLGKQTEYQISAMPLDTGKLYVKFMNDKVVWEIGLASNDLHRATRMFFEGI